MGKIHVGVGGWTYAPWRGVFYPKGLAQKRGLEFGSETRPYTLSHRRSRG